MAQAEWNAPTHVMTDSPPAPDPTPIQPSDTQEVQEISTNPQVAALQVIFPDFDPIILQSVLDSVNGNQDRAIDKLLGMSDPEYQEQQPSTIVNQTELDEEFARNLLIQEREEASYRRHQQRRDAPQDPVPHQQPEDAPGQNSSGTGPNVQEFTDTFNRLAESGKRTFNTLFSKVKARIQELDQPRPDPGSSSTTNGGGGGFFSSVPSHQDRHAMMTQAHYQPTDTPPVRGYDMSYQSSPPSVADENPPASSIQPDQRSPSPEITLGSNHSNQQAPTIDPAKLGILPKRPVTLGGSSPPQQRSTEELEYAENPFEDGRHK